MRFLICRFSKMRKTYRRGSEKIKDRRIYRHFRFHPVWRVARKAFLSAIVPVLFLLFWHSLSLHVNNPIKLPTVAKTLDILLNPLANVVGVGSILRNTYVSLMRVLFGYAAAAVVAVPLGVLIGYSRTAKQMLLPFLNFFRSIPPMSLVPLALAWFGIASLASLLGLKLTQPGFIILNNMRISMLAIIFFGAFFPILSSAIFGVESVRKTLIDSVRSMGASPVQQITKVYLPHAMPSIFTGLQVGLGTAWMVLICAEMLPGSIAGVGYMISHAYQVARIDVVIAGIISISVVGALLQAVFLIIESFQFRWKNQGK